MPFFLCILYIININNNNYFIILNFININKIIILLFYFIFLVKFPVYFFHLWLPKAHVEAPVTGSIVLAAILLKIGSYGLIRILYIIFFNKIINNFIILFTLIGLIIRIFICLFQIDQKSLIAYSSVNHITIIFLCILIYNYISFKSAIIIIFTHGLISSALFNYRNIIYENFRTRNIFFIQGLVIIQPIILLFLIISLIRNFRVPPFISIISEVIMFITFFNFNFIWIFSLLILIFLSCYYSINIYNIRSHGKTLLINIKIKSFNRELLNIFFYIIIIIILLININILFFT